MEDQASDSQSGPQQNPQEEEMELDPDDTPLEEVKASLRRALQESKSGQRIPIVQMWDGIDTTP